MLFLRKLNIKKMILLFCFAIFFLISANSVLALELEYPSIFGISINENSNLGSYAKYFFNVGIAIAVILAVIIVAFGGIYFLVDYSKGKIKGEGIAWIKAGIAGLLLTICAYLIAYTINPALVIFDLKRLPILTIIANLNNPNNSSGIKIDTYNEIPIGSLTENLLARTMACYDYDDNGDPIDGEKIITDDGKELVSPTYLENDRADCVLKISKAIENKSKLVEKLSDKIVEMMDECSCGRTADKEPSACQKINPSLPGYCPGDRVCVDGVCTYPSSGSSSDKKDEDGYCIDKICEDASCEISGDKECKDNCNSKCECGNEDECDLCPSGYRDKIEHGPICITYLCNETDEFVDNQKTGSFNSSKNNEEEKDKCKPTEKKFAGLDEFRSEFNNSYEAIKKEVEIGSAIIVNEKEITVIKNGNCEICDIKCQICDMEDKNYNNCLTERQKCMDKVFTCENKRKICLIENSPWYKLRIIDQLTYLKGKLEEIKQKVKKDLDNLEKGEDELGKCYIADSYVDFLKTYESTDKKKTIIKIEQNYTDQDTGKHINPDKYCEGFQYNNSTCYSQCQKICPANEIRDFQCFANIQDCSDVDENKKEACIKEQQEQYQKCLFNQSCINGASSYSTFKECFLGCKQNCSDQCSLLCDEEEKTSCQKICDDNSMCIIKNAGTCLVDFKALRLCASKYNDIDLLKKCAENAATCEYCSDQYAGYSDCVNSLQQQYSSSYIYKYPNIQICKNPYQKISPYQSNNNQEQSAFCITLYPETTKCPSSSKCPQCPCGVVDDTNSETTNLNSEYRVCSSSCDNFYYKDDPLTFYCKTDWWTKDDANKEIPEGEERLCQKSKEIPVGQTVDNSEEWGNLFLNYIDKITKTTQEEIDYLIKIGDAKNYCECTSTCDKEPLCSSECEYHEEEVTNEDGVTETKQWCSRSKCSGQPCEKMIVMLGGGTCDERYPGVTFYLDEISKIVYDFSEFVVINLRSDILKMLNYSRKMTDECSTTQNNYGAYVKELSCTRVEDEIISPIIDKNNKIIYGGKSVSSYCYGKELGKVLGTSTSLMDNWFCCELREKKKQ